MSYSRLNVECIQAFDQLEKIQEDWNSLWSRSASCDLFLQYDWFRSWWAAFATEQGKPALIFYYEQRLPHFRGEAIELNILTVRRQNSLVAIFPLLRLFGKWNSDPFQILCSPNNGEAPRSGLLTAEHSEEVTQAVRQFLIANKDWDLLMLEGVSSSAPSTERLGDFLPSSALAKIIYRAFSHHVITIAGTFDEYLATRTSHFRNRLRRSERELTGIGVLSLDRYDTPKTLTTGINEFLEIDRESWKAKGGVTIGGSDELLTYYRSLTEKCTKPSKAEIWILKMNQEPAAGFFCMRNDRCIYTLKTSFKEKFASSKYSASMTLLYRILEKIWNEKLLMVDFVGAIPFVERWGSSERKYDSVRIFCHAVVPSTLTAVGSARLFIAKAIQLQLSVGGTIQLFVPNLERWTEITNDEFLFLYYLSSGLTIAEALTESECEMDEALRVFVQNMVAWQLAVFLGDRTSEKDHNVENEIVILSRDHGADVKPAQDGHSPLAEPVPMQLSGDGKISIKTSTTNDWLEISVSMIRILIEILSGASIETIADTLGASEKDIEKVNLFFEKLGVLRK